MKQFNIGVRYDDEMLSIFLYADDIIWMAETEQDLQNMLLCAVCWCKRWRLMINQTKTQIMTFRNQVLREVFFLSLLAIINIWEFLLMNILPFYTDHLPCPTQRVELLGEL